MKLSQLKEFIKTVVKEEEDYQELFKNMLAKTGKNIPDMSDDEKKKFFNDVDDSYKAKSESVNESDMDAKLPKDLLIQVVEALIIQVITQASTRKINIPASDIELLRNNLKKEINSGKITTVGQIMKTIQKLHPMRESVNEANLSRKEMDRYANGISNLTATNAKAVKKFIEDNDLDAEEIYKLVTKGGLVERVRFIKALSGTPGNSTAKWYVRTFQNESVKKGVVNEEKSFFSKLDTGDTIVGKFPPFTEFVVIGTDGKKMATVKNIKTGKTSEIYSTNNFKIKESVKEAALRRQGNGGQLNELGILGSSIAIALGLTGAYALIKGSYWVKEKLGDASYDLLKKLDTQLKAKKAIEDKAQLMDTIKPMIDRLSEDAKLKQLYAELPEWGSSISKRQTNINAERAKQLRKIGEYIKSKLTEDEVKYFSAISQFFRKGTLDELIKEAAFRTLFTHPIWKKAGANYVDSKFLNGCQRKIPLSDLVHLGMGDFMLKTPHGNISFDRVSDQFDGMSGRAHKMTGNKELMGMLIKKMRAKVVHSESVNKSIKKKINEWSSNDVLTLLGGKRFLATSGAYAMSGNVAQKTAKFNFKTPGKNGINNVWITETSPDTYTINFIKVEGEDVNVSPIKNVSGDKLKSIFTKYTGLKTP